ncbi:hypothetical protein BC829DRAFT_424923 [Chytridium lagenaria]|nr:hypothetical protein BC829DRAFT_424923 [Chytridium lagenaria]
MLPKGVFPKYLAVVGLLALYNGVQCFVPQMRLTHRIYALKPDEATSLMARMMGTWTTTSGIVRIYTAYNLDNAALYQACMWTYVIAAASFSSEVFYYETAPITSPGVWPTFFISG